MAGIYVEPGRPAYVSFPLEAMAETLAAQKDVDSFVDTFIDLPLEEQLALFSLKNEQRADIERLAAKLKPGEHGLRTSSVTHTRDCGISSGETTMIYTDSFIVGDRGLYFGAKTGRGRRYKIVADVEDRSQNGFKKSDKPEPRVLLVFPILDLKGHYSVHERGLFFGSRHRELQLGDLTLGAHTHYLDQEQPRKPYEPSNRRLVLGRNVRRSSDSFKMLKKHLKQNAA